MSGHRCHCHGDDVGHAPEVTDFCTLNQPAPVDWPARFRKAADAAEKGKYPGTTRDLRSVADRLSAIVLMEPDVVAAIGRALLGEDDR